MYASFNCTCRWVLSQIQLANHVNHDYFYLKLLWVCVSVTSNISKNKILEKTQHKNLRTISWPKMFLFGTFKVYSFTRFLWSCEAEFTPNTWASTIIDVNNRNSLAHTSPLTNTITISFRENVLLLSPPVRWGTSWIFVVKAGRMSVSEVFEVWPSQTTST